MWSMIKKEKDNRVLREFVNIMADNEKNGIKPNNKEIPYFLCVAKDKIKQIDKQIEEIDKQVEEQKKKENMEKRFEQERRKQAVRDSWYKLEKKFNV